MAGPIRQRGTLLALAAEGLAAAVAGCAAAFDHGQPGGDRFAPGIVRRWREWFPTQHRARQMAALEQLAGLPAAITREEATAAVERMTPAASADDRTRAVAYLCALPRTAQRKLVPDPLTGGLTLPSFQATDNDDVLRHLLPFDVPPAPPNAPLAGTPYTLGDLVRSDAAGVVYRATQGETRLAVQFPRTLPTPARLDQLVRLGQEDWPERLVRLISYNVDGKTPYLVLDTVPAADLTTLLIHLRHQTGRGPAADEVWGLMKQVAAALAALHERGLAHGSIGPASVLISGDSVKLADLAFATSGSPGDDVRAFGLLWYRLLLADWDAIPGGDWQAELVRAHEVPANQVELLAQCLADGAARFADGRALVAALEPRTAAEHRQAFAEVTPEEIRAARLKRERLLLALQELRDDWLNWEEMDAKTRPFAPKVFLVAALLGVLFSLAGVVAWGFTPLRAALTLPFGLALGFALERWLHWHRRSGVRQRYAEIIAASVQLASEYSDEVDAWGGAQVLRNVEVVREFIQALQLDGGPAL